jgi:AraC family transcriptional regulator of adaptative response / DNA-3-methyladenine glycosylase II
MVLDADAAYLAVKARDARFDGRLFVGVTSTGVYCRPVCRVRTPRRENCRFFETRALAEAATFRPCLKCRPEIAPGLSQMDSSRTLADTAAVLVEQAVQDGETLSLPHLAARLGVSDRHLRRIFQATHGVAPLDYLTTQRLLLAKQLLTDTPLPVAQVALASGFESLRRFNAAFAERYRFNPTQLRRAGGHAPQAATLRLAYRPPLDLQGLAGLLRAAATARRRAGARPGTAAHRGLDAPRPTAAGLAEPGLRARAPRGPADALTQPEPGARRAAAGRAPMLDLDADPSRIDPVLATLPVAPRPGLRLPGTLDGFEAAVRVILGQQVTVKAGCTLAQRLVAHFGEPLATPYTA